MILDTRVSYPYSRTYVLKLHADADPQRGVIVGRLEHLASGQQFHFGNAEELLACVTQAAAITAATRDSLP